MFSAYKSLNSLHKNLAKNWSTQLRTTGTSSPFIKNSAKIFFFKKTALIHDFSFFIKNSVNHKAKDLPYSRASNNIHNKCLCKFLLNYFTFKLQLWYKYLYLDLGDYCATYILTALHISISICITLLLERMNAISPRACLYTIFVIATTYFTLSSLSFYYDQHVTCFTLALLFH